MDPAALNMGNTAENLHDRFPAITKDRADAYAVASQDKLAAAYANGQIQPDLVPVATMKPGQGWTVNTVDEPPRPGTTLDDLAALKTPFRAHGRVTAGNAAGLNDGATAALLASAEAAEELGLPVRMRLVSYAFAGVEPEVMGIGPVPATEKALKNAGLGIADIGLFEINEAFAVQVLSFLDHFGIADDDPRVNRYGGAIAVGHPLASSGVRLMNQLARQFEEDPSVRFGMTTMCIGLGMGATVIWENPHHAGYGSRRRSRHHHHHRDWSRSMSAADFRQLADLFPNETVTHSYVQDIELPAVNGTSPGTFALVTLDNGLDHTKPTTLGPNTLIELGNVLAGLKERAARGEIAGVGVTGKPYFLVAGADLSTVKSLGGREHGLSMAQLGHDVYATLAQPGRPQLRVHQRTGPRRRPGDRAAVHLPYGVHRGRCAGPARGLHRPHPGLGRRVHPAAADRSGKRPQGDDRESAEQQPHPHRAAGLQARHGGRHLRAADFVEQSLAWAAQVIAGTATPERANAVDPPVRGRRPLGRRHRRGPGLRRGQDLQRLAGTGQGPGRDGSQPDADPGRIRRLECETLADLMQTDEFRSTVYAFLDLVQRRSKRPAGAPDRKLARPVTKIGVVGAGLMASQLALLFARQLKVPVVLTDIDQARVDKGVGYVHAEVDKLLAKKRISPDAANRTRALVTGSVSKDAFADADFVIEAVFEELNVKKQVFEEVEAIVSPECILATNTSSLSVTAMAADLRTPSGWWVSTSSTRWP